MKSESLDYFYNNNPDYKESTFFQTFNFVRKKEENNFCVFSFKKLSQFCLS